MFDPCITHHFSLHATETDDQTTHAKPPAKSFFLPPTAPPPAPPRNLCAHGRPAENLRRQGACIRGPAVPHATPRGVFVLATRPARIAICASARRSNCASDLALTPASHHWRGGGRLFAPHGTAPSQAHHRHWSQALQRRRGQGNNSPTAKRCF